MSVAPGADAPPVSVAVLVITMRRPAMLERLLESLSALEFSRQRPLLDVVVVDNDAEGSARPVCDAAVDRLGLPLRYVVEPRRGIPFARNRALACARPDVDFVAFVDDDEVVDPRWLEELLRVQRQHGADAVAGPVVSRLPAQAPAWARSGNAFRHPRHPTGTRLSTTATNNVLVRRVVFEQIEPWFDERLALSGGSDRHFFLRLTDAGYKLVWADRALVFEEIPSTRVSVDWVLRRMYRQGICNAFCEIDLQRVQLPRVRMAATGAGYLMAGLGLLPIGFALGRHRAVQCARYVAYGVGLSAGVIGRIHDEYTEIHGG